MPRPLPSNIESGPGQGVGRPGPPGPPGPGFSANLDLSGTASFQEVTGFRGRPLDPAAPSVGDAYIFDGTEWAPSPAGGGGGGSVPNLTNIRYVDSGTAVPGPSQDGSIGKPFSSILAALTAVLALTPGSWTLLIAPGDYSGESLTGLDLSDFFIALQADVDGTELYSAFSPPTLWPAVPDQRVVVLPLVSATSSTPSSLLFIGCRMSSVVADGTLAFGARACSVQDSSVVSTVNLVMKMFGCAFEGAFAVTTPASGSFVDLFLDDFTYSGWTSNLVGMSIVGQVRNVGFPPARLSNVRYVDAFAGPGMFGRSITPPDGTPQNPFFTLQDAIDSMSGSGGTIYVTSSGAFGAASIEGNGTPWRIVGVAANCNIDTLTLNTTTSSAATLSLHLVDVQVNLITTPGGLATATVTADRCNLNLNAQNADIFKLRDCPFVSGTVHFDTVELLNCENIDLAPDEAASFTIIGKTVGSLTYPGVPTPGSVVRLDGLANYRVQDAADLFLNGVETVVVIEDDNLPP